MTLQQALKQFNSEEILYIGSKSAFFFIGTMNQLNEEIHSLNNEWEQYYKDSLTANQKQLNYSLTNPPKPNTVIKKKVWIDGRHIEKEYSYEEQVQMYNEKIKSEKASVNTSEKYLKAWKPFENREVLHVYRTINKDGLIINVKGYESGDFWMRTEAERKRKGLKPILGEEKFYEI